MILIDIEKLNQILLQYIMKIESDQEVEKDDPRNLIKRAEREKEFRTAGQQKEILINPNEMYETVAKYGKTFKNVKTIHPIYKHLSIIDFSVAARGPQEDQIYSTQPFYRNNVRRGNTLVVDKQAKQVHWGRKGLVKFFDINQKSLQAIVDSNIAKLRKKDKDLHYAIFSQIENVLSCNDELQMQNKAKCHVFRLNKANGENAQISYYKPTDEWVISSKNVSVLVAKRDNLKAYQGDRFQFAFLIAHTWFNIIQKKEKNQVQALKTDLDGKTIVGQYCGNPDFQHLVKYQETTIFFYALVELNSQQTCVPPIEAFKFLTKYHLPIVKNYEHSFYGKYTSFVELGESLQKLFTEVATSSIFEDEEGSVIYFVLQKPKIFCEFVADRYLQAHVPIPSKYEEKEVWWNVSSLGKMKTLEYRILRKLREKLKFFTRLKKGESDNQKDQKKLQEKYGSFEKQVYHLVKEQELSKPLQYFFCAAIVAFDFVFKNRKNQRNLTLLTEHYLDFLSVIFWSIENKKEVTPAMMANQQLHKELRGTNWEKYSIEVANHYQQMLEKLAPRYAKIKKSLNVKDLVQGQEELDEDEN